MLGAWCLGLGAWCLVLDDLGRLGGWWRANALKMELDRVDEVWQRRDKRRDKSGFFFFLLLELLLLDGFESACYLKLERWEAKKEATRTARRCKIGGWGTKSNAVMR
ncbi:hypothetical protein F4813DRAFT_13161 [Daldinia decipiens]|uniref:uncharacterized protein n=1 Tax=Daldinia decipiens TaxID=326647 RepID=UPI0020C1EB06|nr:uncharacterized protein F4813DRAFT_13161 [Daldinia decipiens]KAI1662873.1 hypothetical protein F4813DRAFT_13161 [Daldinia decipiens]